MYTDEDSNTSGDLSREMLSLDTEPLAATPERYNLNKADITTQLGNGNEIPVIEASLKEIFSTNITPDKLKKKATSQNHYKCTECPQILHTKSGLLKHQKYVHGPPQICPKCGKTFQSKTGYRHHLTAVHGDLAKFPCTFPGCSKSFIRSDTLQAHVNIHLNAKTFICKNCDKAFRSASNLNEHRRICGTDLSSSYSCLLCPKMFKTKRYLEQHLQGHRGRDYICNICQKAFTFRGNLNRHLKKCEQKSKG